MKEDQIPFSAPIVRAKLTNEYVVEAPRRGVAFLVVSLQDCRPKGVTEKMARGMRTLSTSTMHTSERMARQVYERRRTRVARAAR